LSLNAFRTWAGMVVWPRSVIVDLNICLLFILHCSYKYIVSLDDLRKEHEIGPCGADP
jgi:hypothetical protein